MNIGDRIGQYEVTGRLGQGAMGTVYKGVDTQLGREVAIKVLLAEISSKADLVERFRREATTLARLHHGNICSVYAFVEHQGEHLMILQCLEGQTLEDLLLEKGAIPPDQARAYCKDVLSGLHEAHSANVVHRDLKPANIMITPAGKAVIMDFGIARVRGEKRATREGMTVCTVEYASPEQIRGEDVDARSDLYSLGLVFYEMLEGSSPYAATTEYEWMKAHTEQEIDARHIDDRFGKKIRQFIGKAVEKNVDKRFASASTMLAAIEELPATIEPRKGSGATGRKGGASSAGSLAALVQGINPIMGLSALLLMSGVVFFAVAHFSASRSDAPPAPSVPTVSALPAAPIISAPPPPLMLPEPTPAAIASTPQEPAKVEKVAAPKKRTLPAAQKRQAEAADGWATR